MDTKLYEQLIEADFMPFNIETMSKEQLISEEVFSYIFAIEDKIKREKVIIKLEEQAKKESCLLNFKRILNKYNKEMNKEVKKTIKKEQLKHNEVADKLLEENSIRIYENNLYIYVNGVYTDDTKAIERKIIQIVPDATSNFRSEVYKYLLLNAEKIKLDKENGIINFRNGLLNTKERIFYEHTPEVFSINQINTIYNESARKVQAVDDVLDRLSTYKQERKQTILEMIGYSMTTSVRLQKAFILYGETARNGKTTLINIITELIGRENIGNVSFKDINKNRFAASGIKNKLLNAGSEMTEEYIEDVSIFKMYVTGDYVEVEKKFEARQMISPYAKFIYSANTLPNVSDKTNGFYRRLQIIPLETSFTDKDAKDFNYNDLVTEEALQYLARISLEAYMSMGEQFSNYEESNRELEKYQISSSSVLAFINDKEQIEKLCSNVKTLNATEVYSNYKEYCIDNQYRIVGRNKFYKEIEKNKLITIGEKNHQKVYTFNL